VRNTSVIATTLFAKVFSLAGSLLGLLAVVTFFSILSARGGNIRRDMQALNLELAKEQLNEKDFLALQELVFARRADSALVNFNRMLTEYADEPFYAPIHREVERYTAAFREITTNIEQASSVASTHAALPTHSTNGHLLTPRNRELLQTMNSSAQAITTLLNVVVKEKEVYVRFYSDLRFVISGVAFVLGIVLSVVITRSIRGQVQRLNEAAHKVAAGDFETVVSVETDDEVGNLARSFNIMTKNIRTLLQEKTDLLLEIEHQKKTSIRMMNAAQEQEQQRIAKDLHDGLGPLLSVVKLHLSALQNLLTQPTPEQMHEIETSQQLVDTLVREVRSIAHNMMPGSLETLGLAAALDDFMRSVMLTNDIRIELHVHNLEQRMDSFVEISLYRVVQELITNILNHATATRATIQIVRHASTCVLMVEDNGCGMDTETASRQGGIGLNNIRSRIDALSGSVHIDSTLGRGTTVTIEIPLANFAITSPEPR
jgi:signal transduction histidine kinase